MTQDYSAPVPPPPGYRESYQFHYPVRMLSGIALLLFVTLCPLLTWGTYLYHTQWNTMPLIESGVELLVALLVFFLTPVVTIVVHELLHGLVLHLLGYRVSYGVAWYLGAAYAAAFRQFVRRDHTIVVALTPLIVLTTLVVPLLSIPNPFVIEGAIIALVVNTSGAVGDVYVVLRLLRMPPGTLFYDLDIQHMLVFEPYVPHQPSPS